jgi:hypothetical protein
MLNLLTPAQEYRIMRSFTLDTGVWFEEWAMGHPGSECERRQSWLEDATALYVEFWQRRGRLTWGVPLAQLGS